MPCWLRKMRKRKKGIDIEREPGSIIVCALGGNDNGRRGSQTEESDAHPRAMRTPARCAPPRDAHPRAALKRLTAALAKVVLAQLVTGCGAPTEPVGQIRHAIEGTDASVAGSDVQHVLAAGPPRCEGPGARAALFGVGPVVSGTAQLALVDVSSAGESFSIAYRDSRRVFLGRRYRLRVVAQASGARAPLSEFVDVNVHERALRDNESLGQAGIPSPDGTLGLEIGRRYMATLVEDPIDQRRLRFIALVAVDLPGNTMRSNAYGYPIGTDANFVMNATRQAVERLRTGLARGDAGGAR